jgi:hypothetical protein
MLCEVCHLRLGVWNRLLGRIMHPACRERREAEPQRAGEEFRSLLERAAEDPSSFAAHSEELAKLQEAAYSGPS